jgi:hypothetical protein
MADQDETVLSNRMVRVIANSGIGIIERGFRLFEANAMVSLIEDRLFSILHELENLVAHGLPQ